MEDLKEFKIELEKSDIKEREEIDLTIKKCIKTQKSSKSSLRHEYLPDPNGERIVPLPDPQLISKAEKDAQQKVLNKAKKEEALKGLNIVDIVTSGEKYDVEQLKQISELAYELANPNKARAKSGNTPAKKPTRKAKEEINENASIIDLDATNDQTVIELYAKPKKEPKQKTPASAKKREKITIDTESEQSFDEGDIESKDIKSSAEKRQLGRARKSIKYNFDESDESSDEESILINKKLDDSIEEIEENNSDIEEEKQSRKRKTPEKKASSRIVKKAKITDEEEEDEDEADNESDSDFETIEIIKKSSSKKEDNMMISSKRVNSRPRQASRIKSIELINDSDSSSLDEKTKKGTRKSKRKSVNRDDED